MTTPTLSSSRHFAARSRAMRGFTLVELMIVVAMVGVLAALAIVGYRKYIASAQSSEATALLQNIRVAQESYRSEALSYLEIGTALDGGQLYPRIQSALDDRKVGWGDTSTALGQAWAQLNVRPEGAVRFGYGLVANLPGEAFPALIAGPPDPNWGAPFGGGTPTEPYFIASAIGDLDDDDAQFAVLQTASFSNEVFVYQDTE